MAFSIPLRFGPLGPNTAHLCIDMQNLFAEDTPWHTPWMNRVLPVVAEIAERHAAQTIFTRFVPARHPDELPGSWRRYYRRWSELTLERIDRRLLDLAPPLARLVLAQDALCSSSDKTHDALMTLYCERFSEQIETADTEAILATWPS